MTTSCEAIPAVSSAATIGYAMPFCAAPTGELAAGGRKNKPRREPRAHISQESSTASPATPPDHASARDSSRGFIPGRRDRPDRQPDTAAQPLRTNPCQRRGPSSNPPRRDKTTACRAAADRQQPRRDHRPSPVRHERTFTRNARKCRTAPRRARRSRRRLAGSRSRPLPGGRAWGGR